MKPITARLLFTLLVVGLLTFIARAQEAYQLEYKFVKGKTYRYTNVSSSNITQEMMGRETKMTSGSNFTIRAVVENVTNDGLMVVLLSADSATVSQKMPMRDTTMVMKNLIGKRMKVTVAKTGEIRAREVVDSVIYEGAMRSGPQREAMNFLRLPVNPVKVGEKWNSTTIDTVESMGGKMINKTNIDYTLIGKEQKLGYNCLKITFSGKTSVNGNSKMMGMELFIEGSGKTGGTLYFDPQKGLQVLTESTSDVETTMAATGQQQMTIPMSQSTKSTSMLVQE